MPHFFRFPHTPHIAWLAPGCPRDDKVLSTAEATALLAGPVVLEEKLDGANLGFSVAPDGRVRAQNRGQYWSCRITASSSAWVPGSPRMKMRCSTPLGLI